ncbi:MAG: hypothetical protein KAU83_09865, partial [Bacteroidales bacterium]|nr:hypothetical protein [Bacteroidales bacterium]
MNYNSYQKTCGQIIYDGYAIPSTNTGVWRRPNLSDLKGAFTSGKQTNNLLARSAFQLANALKVLCIFFPSTLVYPYWLLNNPLLLFLANLPDSDPNNIRPVFENDFFKIYWGQREIYRYSDIINGLYPKNYKPTMDPNSSWLNDVYHERSNHSFFEDIIRKHLQFYLYSCLSKAERNIASLELDPMRIMLDLAKKLAYERYLYQRLPYSLTYESQHIQYLLNDLVDFFSQNNFFDMTKARSRWRTIAHKKHFDKCLLNHELLDWFIRENIYLPANSIVTQATPSGYSKWSGGNYFYNLKVAFPKIKQKGADVRVVYIKSPWPEVHKGMMKFEELLSNLSFEFIWERIRNESFYDNYVKLLKKANSQEAFLKSVEFLMGHIPAIIYDETKHDIFKDRGVWKIIGWDIDRDGVLFATLGVVAGGISGYSISLPFGIPILGALSGGAAKAAYDIFD